MKTFLMNDPRVVGEQVFLLPTDRGILVIDVATIVRVAAISNYSKVYFTNNKTMVVAKVLRWFEGRLPAGSFIRVHRTHLVNQYLIQHYEPGKIKLRNGEYIDVAKRRKHFFLECWKGAA